MRVKAYDGWGLNPLNARMQKNMRISWTWRPRPYLVIMPVYHQNLRVSCCPGFRHIASASMSIASFLFKGRIAMRSHRLPWFLTAYRYMLARFFFCVCCDESSMDFGKTGPVI